MTLQDILKDNLNNSFYTNSIDHFYDFLPKFVKLLSKQINVNGISLMLVKDENELFSYFIPQDEESFKGKFLERVFVYTNGSKSRYYDSLFYSHYDLEHIVDGAKKHPSSFRFILEGKSNQLYYNVDYIKSLIKKGYLNSNYLERELKNYNNNKADASFVKDYPTFEYYVRKLTVPLKVERDGKLEIYGLISFDRFDFDIPCDKPLSDDYVNSVSHMISDLSSSLSDFFVFINDEVRKISKMTQQIKENLNAYEQPPYTLVHSKRVNVIYLNFLKWLNSKGLYKVSSKLMMGAYYGSLFHDVGKIMVDKRILNKPAKLTVEEFNEVKKHTLYGYDLIKNSGLSKITKDIVLHHHEAIDGSGYPHGLSGKKIPDYVKIFSVVDVFDALTSERSYKKMFSINKAMEIIHHMSDLSKLDKKYASYFSSFINESVDDINSLSTNEIHDSLYVELVKVLSEKPFFRLKSDDEN